MPDARTVHASAVDALLDQLMIERAMCAALFGPAAFLCEHADALEALRKLHIARVGVCSECRRRAPCRTAMILDGA